MGTMSWDSINKISRRSQGQSMECVAAGQPGASPGKVDNRVWVCRGLGQEESSS